MDLSGLESIFLSIHTMLAAMTHTPELAMSDAEAKMVLNAIEKVMRHYSTGRMMPQKYIDMFNLVSVCGAVYGPRIMVAKMRTASNAARDVTPKGTVAVKPVPQPSPSQAKRDQSVDEFLQSQMLHQMGDA